MRSTGKTGFGLVGHMADAHAEAASSQVTQSHVRGLGPPCKIRHNFYLILRVQGPEHMGCKLIKKNFESINVVKTMGYEKPRSLELLKTDKKYPNYLRDLAVSIL